MTARSYDTMINPPIEELLDRVDAAASLRQRCRKVVASCQPSSGEIPSVVRRAVPRPAFT